MPDTPTPPQPIKTNPLKPWAGFFLVVGSLIILLLGFFGYGVLVNYRQLRNTGIDVTKYQTTAYTSASNTNTSSITRVPRSQIETSDDPSVGPTDALVTIVEFGDFECPFCGEAFPIVKDILQKYQNRIRFIFRDFPNPSLHVNALPAALAASCAQEQGKFWQYYDFLFLHQDQLTADDLKTYAQQVGLNALAYDQCVSSQRHLQEILDDYNAGVAAGVRGTPTWFVNGYRIQGVLTESEFNKLIDLGLAGKL